MSMTLPVESATQPVLGSPRHILTVGSLERLDVEQWMNRADELRTMSPLDRLHILRGRLVATLFYEPSTRTRLSFESAILRLGGQVVSSENAKENSSAKKGETLEDVFRVVGGYVDAIVIRHHENDTMANAAPVSPVPVINAGSGSSEHPTQALLDVYTIYREFGRVDGLKICLLGDLRYGRTVHSLLKLLTKFKDIEVALMHPPSLGLPESLLSSLEGSAIQWRTFERVEDALAFADVVYQTRVQKERLAHASEAVGTERYKLTKDSLSVLKETARILHPLPRVDELDAAIDEDIRAAYFRQVENGMYLRMALLEAVIGRCSE